MAGQQVAASLVHLRRAVQMITMWRLSWPVAVTFVGAGGAAGWNRDNALNGCGSGRMLPGADAFVWTTSTSEWSMDEPDPPAPRPERGDIQASCAG